MSRIEGDKKNERIEIETDSPNEFYAALGAIIMGLGILVGGWLYSKKLGRLHLQDSYKIPEDAHGEETEKNDAGAAGTATIVLLVALSIGALFLI
jgi:hypothetical protein